MNLTPEQIEAVRQGLPVRIAAPEIGEEIVLVRASRFQELQEILDDRQEKAAWAKLGMEAASRWTKENPY